MSTRTALPGEPSRARVEGAIPQALAEATDVSATLHEALKVLDSFSVRLVGEDADPEDPNIKYDHIIDGQVGELAAQITSLRHLSTRILRAVERLNERL